MSTELSHIPSVQRHGHRLCTVCRSVRMIAEMAPDERFADGYSSICVSCEENKQEHLRHVQEKKLVSHLKSRVLAAGQVAKVTELCNTLLDTYGGLKGFCELWRAEVDEARKFKPGSATVLQQFTAIAKIILAANAAAPPRRNEQQMSDDELFEAMQRFVSDTAAQAHIVDAEMAETVADE